MEEHVNANNETSQSAAPSRPMAGASGYSRRGAVALGFSLLVGAGAAGAYLEIHRGSGNGPLLKGLSAGAENVNALAFSENDALVGAGVSGTGLVFWNISTGAQAWTTSDQIGDISTLSLSRSGATLLGADGGLSLWNAQSGSLIRSLQSPGSVGDSKTSIYVACFSEDGRRAASGDQGGVVWFWDTVTWQPGEHIKAHDAAVTAVQFSPDGRRLATGGWDDAVRFWDAQSGRRSVEYDAPGYVNALVFHPDGDSVFVGASGSTYRVNVADGRVISTYPGLDGIVRAVCLSPDGSMLAAADASQSVRVWEVASHTVRATWSPSTDPYALAWSTNGSMIASGGEDGTVEIWNAKF